jgi:hypothetical protein
MDLYALIVFVHVAAAVALLSSSVVASPGVRAAVRRAKTTQEIRAYLAIGRPLLILEPASALVVLASGLYLTNVANFWTQGWVQVSIAFWIVNALVAGAMVKPAIGRVAAEAARASDGPVGHDLDDLRQSPRWSLGGDLLMATDAAILYVMTMKPELAGAVLVVIGTILFVAAARATRHGLRRTASARSVEPGGHAAHPTH